MQDIDHQNHQHRMNIEKLKFNNNNVADLDEEEEIDIKKMVKISLSAQKI